MLLKNHSLILYCVVVSGIAALYGVAPRWFARSFLGVAPLDVNFAHILRAVMCLYLGLGLFWLRAALVPVAPVSADSTSRRPR